MDPPAPLDPPLVISVLSIVNVSSNFVRLNIPRLTLIWPLVEHRVTLSRTGQNADHSV